MTRVEELLDELNHLMRIGKFREAYTVSVELEKVLATYVYSC